MRSQNRWTGIGVGVFMGVLLSAAVVPAGSLEPSGGPTAAGSQMVTLEQIYERLNAGTAGNKMTSFTEPGSGPASTGHTLDEIMGKLPALDDASGAVPANVVAGKTFWGLTGGQWGLRTGTMPTPVDTDLLPENIKQGVNIFGVEGTYPLAGVPKTGQTIFWPLLWPPVGSDGDLFRGVAWLPRFTINTNGTVTDNLTGLIWLRNANCVDTVGGINKGSGILNWADALTWSNNLASGKCGLTDGSTAGQWRLPNVREMQSLIHYGYYNPALPNTYGSGKWTESDPFTGVELNYYWSSSTIAALTDHAWIVSLAFGLVDYVQKTGGRHVWPVRGGQ